MDSLEYDKIKESINTIEDEELKGNLLEILPTLEILITTHSNINELEKRKNELHKVQDKFLLEIQELVKSKGMKDIWKRGIEQRLVVWEVKKPKQAFYRTIWNHLGVEKKHRFYEKDLKIWLFNYHQPDSVLDNLVTQEILTQDKEFECPRCGNDLVINYDSYICEECTYSISIEK